MANAYDRVCYPSLTFAQTHPMATGVFAAMFGRRFAPFGASRVLEIGCGSGSQDCLSGGAMAVEDLE